MDQNSFNEENLEGKSSRFLPFAYHYKVVDYFKARKKTWDWFAAQNNKEKQVTQFKTNLLKNTYRIEKNSHEDLYRICEEVCKVLNIDAEVTFYQEHNSIALNAAISVIDSEAHIVFSGAIISLLQADEMKALLAHELCHYLFYKIEDESFEITQRITLALANNAESENTMIETARIFQLYLELFCDEGARRVCGDYKPVIQMLVKLNTSLQNVNADSYLNQAKEIVLADGKATQNQTHPDAYIRSLALYYTQEKPDEFAANIEALIEHKLDLNHLDIFKQKYLLSLSIDFIHLIIKPKWMKTAKILNLSEQYFEHHVNETQRKLAEVKLAIEKATTSIQKYFCYILLDFAKVDADIEDQALGHCLELAEVLDLKEIFESTLRKECKLSARAFKKLQENALAAANQMNETDEDSLYTN